MNKVPDYLEAIVKPCVVVDNPNDNVTYVIEIHILSSNDSLKVQLVINFFKARYLFRNLQLRHRHRTYGLNWCFQGIYLV